LVGAGAPLEQPWLAHGCGSHHDGVRAGREEPFDLGLSPNPAGHLDLHIGPLGQALNQSVVVTLAARGVKVDDMDSLGAGCGETVRHVDGVLRVNSGVCVIAALEPHALATEDVDRGNDEHCSYGALRRQIVCELATGSW
jgi:hypothetical protein